MRPIPPSSTYLRASWCAPPRNVSGAQPTEKILRLGDAPQLLALLQREHERLFRIDVLAGFEDRLRNGEMRIRDRQVDDDIDLVIGKKLVDGLRLDAVLFRASLGGLHVEVGASQNLEPLEEEAKGRSKSWRCCRSR